jgi:transcriptional regulator with PAS, ATPase and Fis domain
MPRPTWWEKLLRVVQKKTLSRVGSATELLADLRVMATRQNRRPGSRREGMRGLLRLALREWVELHS